MKNGRTIVGKGGKDSLLDPRRQELLRQHGIGDDAVSRFRAEVYDYYRDNGREFSWRSDPSPYRVLVSEIMLQQTQTGRVADKFEPFVERFPGFSELAAAPFSDVLRLWKGLGYNRRARYLQDCAALVVSDYDGQLPDTPEALIRFPGIGKATAASICVFAYDRPHAFIETNIRTVFIHCFFNDRTAVDDREIMDLVELSLDTDNPRRWFYALMDFGVMLKKEVGNANRKSRHYHRQTPFIGSDRQQRGRILQALLDQHAIVISDMPALLDEPIERLKPLIDALCREGLARETDGVLKLA